MMSLCLIVKDEAACLSACIASARPIVDEVVVVDTGSTDGTLTLAADLADVHASVEFQGDFSGARNFALSLAHGDWILFLDADEQLPEAEAPRLLQFLQRLDPHTWGVTLLRYNFFANGGFFASRELRAFRRNGHVLYERRINESVRASIDRAGARVVDAPVVLNHFGFCRSLPERQVKAQRYLRLFESELTQKPEDPFFHAFQGLILRTLGEMSQARQWAEQALALAPDDALIRLFHGNVVRASGTPTEALAAYRAGLKLAPDNPALLNMTGVQELAVGNLAAADRLFVSARRAEPRLIHTDINRGLVAQAGGRWSDARLLFETAATANPAFLIEQWAGRVEADYFRPTYYETLFGYAGLAYHLAYVRAMELSGSDVVAQWP